MSKHRVTAPRILYNVDRGSGGWSDGWMVGQADGRTVDGRHTDVRTDADGQMDSQTDRRTVGQPVGRTGERTAGLTFRWMGRRTARPSGCQADGRTDGRVVVPNLFCVDTDACIQISRVVDLLGRSCSHAPTAANLSCGRPCCHRIINQPETMM
jgi:hypothetical protein